MVFFYYIFHICNVVFLKLEIQENYKLGSTRYIFAVSQWDASQPEEHEEEGGRGVLVGKVMAIGNSVVTNAWKAATQN
jgi:hypothetical protein